MILTEIKDSVSHSHKEENQSLQRKVQSSQRDRGHNVRQKEELANHRANLPQYGKRPVKEQMPTGKTNFFGKEANHSSYQVTSKKEKAEVPVSSKKNIRGALTSYLNIFLHQLFQMSKNLKLRRTI